MKKTEKKELVLALTEQVKNADALFLADYKGLTFPQITAIRKAVKDSGSDFKVVKNTLLKIALHNNDVTALDGFLKEPTAAAIVTGDVAAAAKEFKKFAKQFDKFNIKCGYLEGTALTANDVNTLADLPSREELLAKMLGSMNAPVVNFVSLLANIPRSLLNVLNAVKDKKQN